MPALSNGPGAGKTDMNERTEIRTPGHPVLERIAWNAAACAVLAVLILLLLGSIEMLDRYAPAPAPRAAGPQLARAAIGPPEAAPVRVSANGSGSGNASAKGNADVPTRIARRAER